MNFAIVGAGMAGLSCAAGLAGMGHAVTLFDKARGPGGRMSTRRMATPLGEVRFDHGAQYFTARDPGFRAQVAEWEGLGCAARWPLPAPDAWVGVPGMNAVIKAMAHDREVCWNVHVDRLEREGDGWTIHAGSERLGRFDAVVLAIPAEQAVPFLSLHDFRMAREATLARSQSCWTGMFAFDQPLTAPVDFLRDAGILAWAVRSNAKPGQTGPEGWVLQANPEWSAAHLEEPAVDIASRLLAELACALDIAMPEPVLATAHRWRYAMSSGLGIGARWDAETRLGVCGDWLLGPRVECAWLSGQQLARHVLESPAAEFA